MKIFPEFLKNTLIGGVVFLLPVAFLFFLFSELFDLVGGLAGTFGEAFFPNSNDLIVSWVISVVLLLGTAFVAGVLARTAIGGKLSGRVTRFAAGNVPGFSMIRQAILRISGDPDEDLNAENVRVVKVRWGNVERFGIVVGQPTGEEIVAFLPGAPNAFAGITVIVTPDQITDTTMQPIQLINGLLSLGRGLENFNSK